MANLLDLMTAEDRKKVAERFAQRVAKRENSTEALVTPEIYITSEFGYYYGWEGVRAIRENQITLKEAFALLEGARKVEYKRTAENANAIASGIAAAFSGKKGAVVKALKPFTEAARVTGE